MSAYVFSDTVDFADTDAAGLVHFSNFFRYVERAESAWFLSMGVAQFETVAGGGFRGFPKVNVQCDFRAPLKAGDAFSVRLAPVESGRSSFTYAFAVLVGGPQGAVAAEGRVTLAFVESGGTAGMISVPLPAALADAVGRSVYD
ncbi:MAG: thioesterase family protein [Opitutales bacterium]